MKNLAMAVVLRDSKLLIQKRYRKDLGMVYEFPGGAIDCDESPVQAAVRELLEETGLEVEGSLGCYEYDNEYGGRVYFVVLRALSVSEPAAVDPERRQSFHWPGSAEIALLDLHAADKLFVSSDLTQYLR